MIESGLVTVIIPCYNQAHFLSETIESVRNQTYQNFEIIVVNDGSTDNTAEIAKSFTHIQLIEQKNLGLAVSRNNGLQKSKGEFIVFLDADDKLLPNALEIGVNAILENKDRAFVCGFCQRIDEQGDPLPTTQPVVDDSDYYLSLLKFNFIWAPSNVMYRRKVFEKVSAFDAKIGPAADYEIYLRIARQFPIYHHSQIITEYRQHQASMSKKFDLMLENVLAVLNAQNEFVKENKVYQIALKKGISFYKYYYLEGTCYQIIGLLKNREWKKGINQGSIFFSYPILLPKVLLNIVKDKLNRMNGFQF